MIDTMHDGALEDLMREAQIARHKKLEEKYQPLRAELAQIEATLDKADTAVQPEFQRLERVIVDAQATVGRASDALQRARDAHNARCSQLLNRKAHIIGVLSKTVWQEKSEAMGWGVPDWHKAEPNVPPMPMR